MSVLKFVFTRQHWTIKEPRRIVLRSSGRVVISSLLVTVIPGYLLKGPG